jgi:predicted esterase
VSTAGPAVRTTHLRVSRTARIAMIGSAEDAAPREVWIACHGYAQLAARFLRRFAAIASPDRVIVAPEALNRFYVDDHTIVHGPDSRVGATWMTREDRLHDIADYIAYLDAVHDHVIAEAGAPAPRVTALGFSQGTATVCRWAAATSRRIDALVCWAGLLPPELEPAPALFGRASLHFVFGDADPAVTPAARTRALQRLDDAGLHHAMHTFAGGHEIDEVTLVRVAAGLAS